MTRDLEIYVDRLTKIKSKLEDYKECKEAIKNAMLYYDIDRKISDYDLHAKLHNFGYNKMTLFECLNSLSFYPVLELKARQLKDLLTAIEAIKMIHNEY